MMENDHKKEPGKLYLCATPIGNLEDITYRVLRVLREADIVAAEDTRHTIKLLNYYNIKKPLVSCHEHNETHSGAKLIEQIKSGQNVALVSDAGTPGISDPGEKIVSMAITEGIDVVPVPGAAALISALIISGISTARFCFEGFLPKGKKERTGILKSISTEERTIILYEAPHRLVKTLKDLYDHLGDRRIAVVREITKLHEEAIRGTLSEMIHFFEENSPKGEFVLVIEGQENQIESIDFNSIESSIPDRVLSLVNQGIDKKTAMRQVAADLGISKNEVYATLIRQETE